MPVKKPRPTKKTSVAREIGSSLRAAQRVVGKPRKSVPPWARILEESPSTPDWAKPANARPNSSPGYGARQRTRSWVDTLTSTPPSRPAGGSGSGRPPEVHEFSSGEDNEPSPARVVEPTRSINPDRPRTKMAKYYPDESTLYVLFREGKVYAYYDVPANVWTNFKRANSPGRFINRVLNNHPYEESQFPS